MYQEEYKICRTCKQQKPITEFHPDRENWIGKLEMCLDCDSPQGRSKRKREWSKTATERSQRKIQAQSRGFKDAEEMDIAWAAHPKLCEMCGDPPEEGKRLCMDHNHKTGKFRGWLCTFCNSAIGFLKDDPYRASRATVYLEKHYSNPESPTGP